MRQLILDCPARSQSDDGIATRDPATIGLVPEGWRQAEAFADKWVLATYVNFKRKPKPDPDASLALAIRMNQGSERQVKRVTDGLNRTLVIYNVRTWRLSRLRRVQRALLNSLRPTLRVQFQQRHEHHGQ